MCGGGRSRKGQFVRDILQTFNVKRCETSRLEFLSLIPSLRTEPCSHDSTIRIAASRQIVAHACKAHKHKNRGDDQHHRLI